MEIKRCYSKKRKSLKVEENQAKINNTELGPKLFCSKVGHKFCAEKITAFLAKCCDLFMCASFCCELSYAKFALDFAGKVCTHNEIAAFLAKCCDLANAKCVADFVAKLDQTGNINSCDVQTA